MALASLASSLFASESKTRSEVMLTGLNPVTDEPEETFVLQFFPEAISDSKAVNFQRKEVPGGTLPLYQWVNSGERNLSFTAIFAADMDMLATGVMKAGEVYSRIKDAGLTRETVDIRTAVAYLRSYLFPKYLDTGIGATQPPRKLRLTIPRSGIGLAGGAGSGTVMPDSVFCVMTQCDVNWEAFFPTGMPRYVSVSLAFGQIAQYGGQVQFPQSPRDLLPAINNQGNGGAGFAVQLGGFLGGLGAAFGGDAAQQQTLGSLQPYTLQARPLK